MLQQRRIPAPVSSDEWRRLVRTGVQKPVHAGERASVHVIVPVYSGYDETLRCIASVLQSANKTPFELVLVDDCGPDPELRSRLGELADTPGVRLLHMQENSGFVAACNAAMSARDGADVVLLNSDTQVYGDWLDRLKSACYLEPDIGNVTPLTNNGEICSYPYFVQDNYAPLELLDSEIDKIAAEENPDFIVDCPTGVGFCMYIRDEMLSEVGIFDPKFGLGYGEENDLCQRGIIAGWRSIITANVFVTHFGGVSFGHRKSARLEAAIALIRASYPSYLDDVRRFVQSDPLKIARARIDRRRLASSHGSNCVFLITHSLGGGTDRHVREMAAGLRADGRRVVAMTPNGRDPWTFVLHGDVFETPNIEPAEGGTQKVYQLRNTEIVRVLRGQRCGFAHVHHSIFLGDSSPTILSAVFLAEKIEYFVTLHDYFAACPRINMIDSSGVFCGEPSVAVCEECIQANGSPVTVNSVGAWRNDWTNFLSAARATFVPNLDHAARMARLLPDCSFTVRPHFETPFQRAVKRGADNQTLRIGIIGAIGPHKGSNVLKELVRTAARGRSSVHFHFIGYTDIDAELQSYGNVTITGAYKPNDLPQLIAASGIDRAFLPSVTPETYSYALSEVLREGLFPIAFDIGAVSQRLKQYRIGRLIPLLLAFDPVALLDEITRPIKLTETGEISMGHPPLYPSILRDYYGL